MANVQRAVIFVGGVGGPAALDVPLPFAALSAIVDNWTTQFVDVVDAEAFIAPNSPRILRLKGVKRGRLRFGTPPQTSQPAAVNGQACFVIFTDEELSIGGGPQSPLIDAAVSSRLGSIKQIIPGVTTLTNATGAQVDTVIAAVVLTRAFILYGGGDNTNVLGAMGRVQLLDATHVRVNVGVAPAAGVTVTVNWTVVEFNA